MSVPNFWTTPAWCEGDDREGGHAYAEVELQLFAPLGRFQPQKNLQLPLIPLNFVRPVTPKVAGSNLVAPAIAVR
jgi:hypothetical protein